MASKTPEAKAAAKAAKKAQKLVADLAKLGVEASVEIPLEELEQKLKEAKAAAKSESKAPSVAVAVYDGAKLIRVYSLADHGEDYKALAEQFVAKPGRSKFTIKPYHIELAREPEPKETEFVTVLTSSGDVVRTYSLKEHGEDYRALAEQFVTKHAKRQYRLA